jgi:hypothetical protein
MRELMVECDVLLNLAFGFAALVVGAVLGWLTLRRWRFVAPLRCASELGICASIGGLGLHILFGYSIAYVFYLLAGHLGSVQSP